MPNAALARWFEPRRAAYPWRGEREPYRVLVSEVMLQQTQAARVVPHYRAFLERFPSVEALAAAARDTVVRAWAGLGYNRRAVALSEAARTIVRDQASLVPHELAALRALPGVGPYTAAAVASIAFGRPVPAIDTNVRRIVARVRLGAEADQVSPGAVREAAEAWLDRSDPGGWNQALMDLGREVCRPLPRCDACPLASACPSRGRSGTSPGRRGRGAAERFEGSSRQLRGAIVGALRDRGTVTLMDLVELTTRPAGDVGAAVAGLARDGLAKAGPAALAGRPGGRVRLARG